MKSILLIGLGRFGNHLAKQLNLMGHQIMAVDKCEEKVNSVLEFVTNAQIGDSTNEEFLRSLGVNDYDVCFVAISSDFQSSLETTSILKELGAKKVISRAERDIQKKLLLKNGADYVMHPEKQVAGWSAIRYTTDHISDYMEISDNYGIYEVDVLSEWAGKTIGELDIRKHYKINIVAIKINEKMNMSIHSDTVLNAGESLLVLGSSEDVQKCFR